MRNVKLKDFVRKYVIDNHDFCVWCPDLSSILYDRLDMFKASQEPDGLCIFDYMIVDSVCSNGDIQINCHFNHRKWNKDCKSLESSQLDDEFYFKQFCLEDFYDNIDE